MRERREKSKREFFTELGDVNAMIYLGELFGEDDPQRFFWLGRAAVTSGDFLGSVLLDRNVQSDFEVLFRNRTCKCRFRNWTSTGRAH
jgi:hypothetical protein